jgi:hypothetical protein
MTNTPIKICFLGFGIGRLISTLPRGHNEPQNHLIFSNTMCDARKGIVNTFDKMSNAIMACAKIKWDAACKNLARSEDNV